MNMLFKTAADFRTSLETRLNNMAVAKGEKLQRLRRKVAFDRFLARIFASEQPNFILKGGYAMELRFKTARATQDIDLTTLHRAENVSLLNHAIVDELRELVDRDMGDYFSYRIGDSRTTLDNAPYGGARYPVTALVNGKAFERFQLDIGADTIISETEIVRGKDWLGFCNIPAPLLRMISIEQQFAEKFHAYTLPRMERPNTRVKDLIDMVLLLKMRAIDFTLLQKALTSVFKVRSTHPLPDAIEPPPSSWQLPYQALANECMLELTLEESFREIEQLYSLITASV